MPLPTGPLNSAAPTTSVLTGGVYNVTPPTPADTQVCALQVDANGNLKTTATAVVASTVKIEDTAGNPLTSTAGSLNVNITGGTITATNPSVGLTGAAAPTSATEIGIVVGGNLQNVSASNPVPVSIVSGELSTVTVTQATAANLNAQVQGAAAADSAQVGNPVLIAGVDAAGNVQELGVADANTTTPAQVLEVGGAVTTAAPTYTTGTLNPLSLDVAGNLRVITTPASGTTPTIVGTLTNNNAAPAATEVGVLPALANAVSPSWTEGRQVLESVDLNGGQRTIGGNIPEITAAWTSATTINTALTLTPILGYGTVLVTINDVGVTTVGAVTFEVSDTAAGTTWYPITGIQTGLTVPTFVLNASLTSATLFSWQFDVTGFAAFRVRLSTAITGAGTANVGIQASPIPNPNVVAIASSVKIISNAVSSALVDNQLNTNFFTSSGNVSEPLSVGDWVYGGAFSGAADATRQGWSKMRTPTVFTTVQATASGATTVWTPGTGNKWRLLKLYVEVTQNASLAAGGVLTITFLDTAAAVPIAFDVFVPTTAVTTTTGAALDVELDLGAFGILSAAANNTFRVNLSSALVTGNVRVNAMGTEE
jgi:hypothetical protein